MNAYDAAGVPVAPFRYPTTYEPTNEPSAPMLLISAIAPPATFFGSSSGTIAKNGPYGAYIAPPAITSKAYDSQKCVEPSAYDAANAIAPTSRNGHTNTLRRLSLSDAHEAASMAIVAARYGSADSQPVSTMPSDEPFFRMDGSHSTKPYTPILQQKYCAHSLITAGVRNASP